MAKRSRTKRKAVEEYRFDDSAYDNVLFTATYDYDELAQARAVSMLAPRSQNVFLVSSFVLLGIMIVALLLDILHNTAVLIVLVILCTGTTVLATNWNFVTQQYAMRTTLGVIGLEGKRHLVVCEDALHLDTERGDKITYDYSQLQFSHSTDNCILLRFSGRRYVYIPHETMSVNRFRDLRAFLAAKARP